MDVEEKLLILRVELVGPPPQQAGFVQGCLAPTNSILLSRDSSSLVGRWGQSGRFILPIETVVFI